MVKTFDSFVKHCNYKQADVIRDRVLRFIKVKQFLQKIFLGSSAGEVFESTWPRYSCAFNFGIANTTHHQRQNKTYL